MKKRTKILGVLLGLLVVSASVSVGATENVIKDENIHRFDIYTGMDKNGNIYELEYEDGVIGESGMSVFSRTVSPKVVNFRTKGSGVTTSYTEYKTGESGYTAGQYGADAAYLGTFDGKVRFMLAGVVGEVAEADVEIVNVSDVYVISCYEAVNGRLIHHIAQNMKTPGYATNLDNGPAPSYIKSGVTYYSYDGHYFYEDYSVMLQDYQNEVRTNSVNPDSPYYNYYQYLPLRSQSSYSANELDTVINSRVTSTSKMLNTGAAFVENQNKYGVNALLAAGVAANESGWGTSSICQNKNNLFGLNATDIMPGENADTYESPEDCIRQFMQHWMSKGYLYPNDWRYYGGFLGNKASGINVKYASDPYWGEKAANVAWSIDKSNGNKDADKYVLGIKDFLSTEHSNLNIRKEASTASSSTVLHKTGGQSSHAFIILGEKGDFYKIQSDGVLNSDRTKLDNSTGEYDFNNMYAYASKQYVKKLQGTISSVDKWTAKDILTDVASPQDLGNAIKLSAKIDGGTTGLQYKFVWMKDDWASWGILSEYSSVSSVSWEPEEGGTYTIFMNVKGTDGVSQTVEKEFVIRNWGLKSIKTNLSSPQAKSTAIKVYPEIVGNSSGLQYKFVWQKNDWASWGVLQEMSSKKEATWTPKETGTYTLIMNVKDSSGYTITKETTFTIEERIWKLESLKAAGGTVQELGDAIKLSAEVSNPNSKLQYKFVWQKDDWAEWGVIRGFSSSNTVEWTPPSVGEYTIITDVKDGTVTEHANLTITVESTKWELKEIKTSISSPQRVGREIKITPVVEGNTSSLRYKFVWQKNNWSKWGILQEYSKNNTITWTPQEEGTYTLIVNVNDKKDETQTMSIEYKIVVKDWKYENVVADNAQIPVGEKVTVKPVITGNTDGLIYKYVWRNENWSEWGVLKEFSEQSEIQWSSEKAGTYYIHVDVKENTGRNLETQIVKIKVLQGSWTILGINASPQSPQTANTKINLSANVLGNTSGLQYKFVWQKNDWAKWGVIQPLGKSDSATWVPEENGTYKIYMDVKDGTGQTQTFVGTYVIADWIISFDPSSGGKVGNKINISVDAVGAKDKLQYKFVWMKNNWSEWGVLQNMSSSNSVNWTPKSKGTYSIYIDIKDTSTGKTSTQTIQYVVK